MLFKGYQNQSNSSKKIGEYPVAYNFSNTNPSRFDANIWYNDTYANRTKFQPSYIVCVARSMNMASQAFLRYKLGEAAVLRHLPPIHLEFVLDVTLCCLKSFWVVSWVV
ncbi:hypothetical protein M758_7G172900 [Ceratodon purpureus]|nr:hypothetical protein M758_7G172900 [Ceratodon purpureus]